MSIRIETISVDAEDPAALARFWAEALGWEVDEADGADDDEVLIRPADRASEMLFVKVPEVKSAKNRIHLDLRPDDQAAEVARFEVLGATRVDIGQGEQTWVVLADPEGNEFCILRALRPDEPAS